MHEVYMCCSKAKEADAERLTALLEEKGIKCWLLPRDIDFLRDWDGQIADAVKGSVIAVYFETAEPSPRIQAEVNFIKSCNTTLMTFDTAQISVENIADAVLGNIAAAREQKKQKERIYPYTGEEPFIFASYSHKDMEKVFGIIRGFQERGYRVWFDEGIDPGTEWDEYIAEHIDKSRYMLAFLSENYYGSSNCKDELAFAREMDKPLLLIYIAEDELPPGMKLRLNRIQAVHWYSYDDKSLFYAKAADAAGLEECRGQEV